MSLPPFSRQDLRQLIECEGGPHLSAFLSAPGRLLEGEQDRIRIGNLVREARKTLREFWMPEGEADKFLEPLQTFADDSAIAQPRDHAIAVFLGEHLFKPFRIGTVLKTHWFIGRLFQIRSLLPELEQLESYYVLTLSEKKVALYEAIDGKLQQQNIQGLHESFKQYEATFWESAPVQIHSGGVRRSGKEGAVFHGHGGIADSEPVDLENYLKHVDHAVNSFMMHRPPAPIILAGVDSLTSLYRHVSHCKTILFDCVSGNVDHLSADQLHERVHEVALQEHDRKRNEKAKLIREHDVPVETNSELILAAAVAGRIDTLFIDKEAELYGIFFKDQSILKELNHAPTGDPADASHDLIEFAAVQTLKTGGTVHAVARNKMPIDKNMVAALRYSLG